MKIKRLNTEEYIQRVIEKHGNIFDYSKVVFSGMDKKIEIICKKHGSFFQLPSNHLKYNGCKLCVNKKISERLRLSIDIFIKRSNEKHNNKFNYSLVEYTSIMQKVKIICPTHNVFEQRAIEHMRGKGCRACVNQVPISRDEYINRFKQKNDERYDYSKFEYIDAKTKSVFICKIHGEFKQLPYSHLAGHHCPKCTDHEKIDNIDTFITKVIKVHGLLYDYSKVKNIENNKQYVEIGCKKHGFFKQSISSHLSGQGCPKCQSSYGERMVRKILTKNNIEFVEQKRFDDCRNIRPLPFDFYIEKKNMLIEYDGPQHDTIMANRFFPKLNLEKIKKHDEIKNKWCEKNNIQLIRIKHSDDIEKVLNVFCLNI